MPGGYYDATLLKKWRERRPVMYCPLHAAAPEMAEALRQVIRSCDDCYNVSGECSAPGHDKARAVLQKAGVL